MGSHLNPSHEGSDSPVPELPLDGMRPSRDVATAPVSGTASREDADHAESLAATALSERGHDAEIVGSRRGKHLRIVDAETDEGSLLVYVDPVTRRTGVVPGA